MTDMPPLQGEDGTTDYSEDSMIRPVGTLPLTDECRHYVEWNEVPNQIKKSVML